MSFDAETLYRLLPAVYRLRDAEQGEPLRALIAVLAEQLGVIEDNIEQLYDDQFIETCADWVVPYIGDLIGYQAGYAKPSGVGSPRAEVAQTIALRRRKGTAAVLEQLARDVTGWNARAVEFFQTLATTQCVNHIRLGHHGAPDLRHALQLERVGSAFDRTRRTVDVRRIASGRGRHNIPNVGLFLWPIGAHRVTRSTAVALDTQRYRISPLNHDMPIYNRPEAEDSISHLAEPVNVPLRLSRRVLDADAVAATRPVDAVPSSYYGSNLSLAVYLNGSVAPVPLADLCVCNLSDHGASWAHLPVDKVALDPVLGRIALPAMQNPSVSKVEVTYHYGFSAEIGGGEYMRETSASTAAAPLVRRVPEDHASIQAALDALGASDPAGGTGEVVITDSGRYVETLSVRVKAGGRIVLRSPREGGALRRASVVLNAPMLIHGASDSEFVLEGLLVSGDKLQVPAGAGNILSSLRIAHTSLVPGRSLTGSGEPVQPLAPSLVVELPSTTTSVERSILGGVRSHAGGSFSATDSVLDAIELSHVAFAGLDDESPGAALSLQGCTAIGKLHARLMPLISNSILLAELAPGDTWQAPVRAEQKQLGCVRFSWLPNGSRVPRRHLCLPPESGYPAPRMLSLRYGTHTYCRLSSATHSNILHGADDDGEMGVFHHVFASARQTNLRLRLDEYLRVGLEAGVILET